MATIDPLETARTQPLRRIAIDPVTRVEGHGKVTLLVDDAGRVHQARLHIVELRGFERFVQGRPYWEAPVMVQRLCGICPVSHHLAAAKAVDQLVGVTTLPPTAEKLRRLLHLGQTLQSHALHFFHLASPDLLFGFDDDPAHRNVLGALRDHPDVALKGVKLRAFGQEVIRVLAGKRVHGVLAIPGGVAKRLSRDDRELLLRGLDEIAPFARDAVELAKTTSLRDRALLRTFGAFDSGHTSLVRADGALELYDGGLRARDARGATIFDHASPTSYEALFAEEVKSWSYMKFPFLRARGPEDGWYRVGPLARLDNADFIATPLAEAERRTFFAELGPPPVQSTLAYHWARMIELLYAAEAIRELLDDPELLGDDLVAHGARTHEGIGVVEAPRGTLIHHYRIDDDDLITHCNLIVSTTHNNTAMNAAVRAVAAEYFDGRAITEGLLNRIEVAVRAYDPCLSCATHALGQMPLVVEVITPDGARLDRLAKHGDGTFSRGAS
jgi:NAD-reducing hydrogenase large subunit